MFAFQGKKTEKEMQQELRQVLMIFREKKEHYNDSMNREPALDKYSTPREVQYWLTAKGFSEKYDTVGLLVITYKECFLTQAQNTINKKI